MLADTNVIFFSPFLDHNRRLVVTRHLTFGFCLPKRDLVDPLRVTGRVFPARPTSGGSRLAHNQREPIGYRYAHIGADTVSHPFGGGAIGLSTVETAGSVKRWILALSCDAIAWLYGFRV